MGVTNLREYISHNPPAVTFFLCLMTLAISFIGLSFYSYSHILPNPDTSKDWNHILSSLSQFQLCTMDNTNSSELVSPVPSRLVEQEKDRETLVSSPETSTVTHLHLKVPLAVTASSGSFNYLSLQTTMEAKQLNLGDKEIVNITIEFQHGNSTYSCLTIRAPQHLLPMRLLPPKCPTVERNTSPILVEARNQLPSTSETCYSLHSTYEPTLTVMLTKEEQSVAVQHLLEVSVCLLGVCFLLCLSAGLTRSFSRNYHWNGLELQNDQLIDN
ncbi:transmembrane protein 248 isoform X2 [Echeneis naucrates]|uniref:Transmembrane protein 248-like n=1 Tax=Echeneis naucrates TaxID=173247 RepID=A0A665X9E3_ECHNA|nr:transmembrane protein 248-like isoform X2 [Echeneis naucrates]